MASYTAIAGVGNTLVSLLIDRMDGYVDADEIALGSPGSEGVDDDFRLLVYLYDVRQNEHLSNDRARSTAAGRPGGAALVLDLHYMLAALPKANKPTEELTTTSTEQHNVLGRAMQVLEDHAIVRRPDLDDAFDRTETITITMESRSQSTLLDVWGTFPEAPYQPSISYVVSPVVIDSRRSTEDQRVVDATFEEYTYAPVREVGEEVRP